MPGVWGTKGALRADQHEVNQGSVMKKSLIVLCSAIALVGCDRNRGGTGSDTSQDTGFRSSRDTTYPSRSMTRDTNSSSSSAITNSSSSSVGAPGAASSTNTGAGAGSSSGANTS